MFLTTSSILMPSASPPSKLDALLPRASMQRFAVLEGAKAFLFLTLFVSTIGLYILGASHTGHNIRAVYIPSKVKESWLSTEGLNDIFAGSLIFLVSGFFAFLMLMAAFKGNDLFRNHFYSWNKRELAKIEEGQGLPSSKNE